MSTTTRMFLPAVLITATCIAGDRPDPEKVGMTFFREMAEGDFEKAYSLLDPNAALSLSPHMLEGSWLDQIGELGEYLGTDDPMVELDGPLTRVTVIGRWARGRRSLELQIINDERIIGMSWLPPMIDDKPTQPRESPIRAELLTIGSSPWKLPAVLAWPVREPVKAAAVLVADSGPLDRSGAEGRSDFFGSLAEGLGEHGIATLRHDKRLFVYRSQLEEQSMNVREDIIEDAVSAVRALREHETLRGVPTYLIGHGLGGLLAGRIAQETQGIAGIVIIAANARRMERALEARVSYLTEQYRAVDARLEAQNVLTLVKRLAERQLDPGVSVLGYKTGYWYDVFDHSGPEGLSTLAKWPGRVLVIFAGRDFETNEEDLRLWKDALSEHPQAQIKHFPELNRLLARGQGMATPYEYTIPKPIDRRVVDAMANWCLGAHALPATPLGAGKPEGQSDRADPSGNQN